MEPRTISRGLQIVVFKERSPADAGERPPYSECISARCFGSRYQTAGGREEVDHVRPIGEAFMSADVDNVGSSSPVARLRVKTAIKRAVRRRGESASRVAGAAPACGEKGAFLGFHSSTNNNPAVRTLLSLIRKMAREQAATR